MANIKTFQETFQNDTIIATCTWTHEGQNNQPNVWVKWSVACSQDEVSLRFYESQTCTNFVNRIEKWCAKNNYNLYSY